MTVVRNIITELREKRLWPLAAVLAIGLVAVPLFLSKSSSPAGAPAPVLPLAGGPAPSLPAVSVTATPSNARLTGPEHDPFHQQVKARPGTTASTGTGSSSSGSGSSGSGAAKTTGSSSAGTPSGATSTGSSTGSAGSTTTTPASTTAPAEKPVPGLTDTQAYGISISITTAGGGVNTIDPVQRLSVLPSNQQPQLVELGVLKGTDRVLFVVQPGTVLGGPGTCTPGPIDCEVVALRPNQIESISRKTSAGVVGVAQMAVTAINVNRYASATAADHARRSESAAGRRLVSTSALSAVSLFRYEPSAGAVLDLRNLTVGGN